MTSKRTTIQISPIDNAMLAKDLAEAVVHALRSSGTPCDEFSWARNGSRVPRRGHRDRATVEVSRHRDLPFRADNNDRYLNVNVPDDLPVRDAMTTIAHAVQETLTRHRSVAMLNVAVHVGGQPEGATSLDAQHGLGPMVPVARESAHTRDFPR